MMTPSVLIFGVGKGFGLSIAKKFGKNDKIPILVARNEERLKEFVYELKKDNISAYYIKADVNNYNDINYVFRQVKQKYGVPETLIYNVGDKSLDDAFSASLDKIKQEFHTNVLGAIQALREFVALTDKDDTHHNILVTGGGAALSPSPLTSTLSLTKAALRSYIYSLSNAIKDKNIYLGLITIQGLSGSNKAMQPDKVASIYFKATQEQKLLEIFYPKYHDLNNNQSDTDQFQELANNPKKLANLISEHPEIMNIVNRNLKLKEKVEKYL